MTQSKKPAIRLPHPHLTSYGLVPVTDAPGEFRLLPFPAQPAGASLPPKPLHNEALTFTIPSKTESDCPVSDNTPYARARRSAQVVLKWSTSELPTVGQVWLVIYAYFTHYHAHETLRLSLSGNGQDQLKNELFAVLLALPHPLPEAPGSFASPDLILLRESFWQGAGSPFGPRPVWVTDPSTTSSLRLSPGDMPNVQVPTLTTKFPKARVHVKHPVRPTKQNPGSIIYSRWIPHLDEIFSLVAVDWRNPRHLELFTTWHNDPRVAVGWDQAWSIERQREYLQGREADPHVLPVFGCFDGTEFSYHEIYWAREDHLGAYFDAGHYDRGRHSLVGLDRFRGPHRVRVWWSGLVHFAFLDDPRTMQVVGEPKESNEKVAEYDREHGFAKEGFVDLPHKRSSLVKISRERFFQLARLEWGDERSLEQFATAKL